MAVNGKSPINFLINNIPATFEKVSGFSKPLLSKAVNLKQVDKEIEFINDTEFRTPFACLECRKIYLQESFLCFLWSVSYFSFFVQEELNREQIQHNELGGFDLGKCPERVRSSQLLKWAVSIRKSWSGWDLSLPNPQHDGYLTDLEKEYIPKVNNIFCHAVSFMLFHEFAHLHLGHTASKGAWSQSQEKEADQFAREVLVNYFKSDQEQLAGALGISVGTIALLFLKIGTHSYISTTHPNTDLRIQFSYEHCDIIDRVDLRDAVKQCICNSCLLYFQLENIEYEEFDMVENIDDAFERILALFDKLNSQ
jgi:hypothetical protein|tara:strand:- start:1314 stop:2243 length:930 start_codon:yes stop_codon:yes gene_type:complete